MATHSSVLAWRIPGTGEAWWAAVYGVTQSRTRLSQLAAYIYISIRLPVYPSPSFFLGNHKIVLYICDSLSVLITIFLF